MEKAKDKVIDAAEATKDKMEQVKDKVTGKQHERAEKEFFEHGPSFGHDERGVMDKTKDKVLDYTQRGADNIQNVADKAENKAFHSKERCGPGCGTENLHFAGNTTAGGYTSASHQAASGPSF